MPPVVTLKIFPTTPFLSAMNLPLHLFRLEPAPTERDSETVHLATETDIIWNRPVFRAPSFPTPRQISSELPFSVNFRATHHASRDCA